MYGLLICAMYIVVILGSGYISYCWVEPTSFLGVLLFLFVWGIMGKLGSVVGLLLLGGMSKSGS